MDPTRVPPVADLANWPVGDEPRIATNAPQAHGPQANFSLS